MRSISGKITIRGKSGPELARALAAGDIKTPGEGSSRVRTETPFDFLAAAVGFEEAGWRDATWTSDRRVRRDTRYSRHHIELAESPGVTEVVYTVRWRPKWYGLIPLAFLAGGAFCLGGAFVPYLYFTAIRTADRILMDGVLESVRQWAGAEHTTYEQEILGPE